MMGERINRISRQFTCGRPDIRATDVMVRYVTVGWIDMNRTNTALLVGKMLVARSGNHRPTFIANFNVAPVKREKINYGRQSMSYAYGMVYQNHGDRSLS
jgi:hypothetical protein